MSNQIDHPTLIREINQKLAERQRGTMFLRTDDGHAFAVAIQNGAITGVSSGLIVGNDAVDKLHTVKYVSYRLSPTPFNPPGSKPGPFAPLVLDDALKSASFEYVDADNLKQFLLTLARDIDDDEQAQQFIDNTISELQETG